MKDYEAAKNAGLGFIGVCTGTTEREDLGSTGSEIVNSLSELLID